MLATNVKSLFIFSYLFPSEKLAIICRFISCRFITIQISLINAVLLECKYSVFQLIRSNLYTRHVFYFQFFTYFFQQAGFNIPFKYKYISTYCIRCN